MDHGARIWLLKTVQKNYWRVPKWYEVDDLVQDGFLHYLRVLRKYQEVRNPAHLMALFKVTFCNHLNDLSNRKTWCTECNGIDEFAEVLFSEGWGEILKVIADAPPEIKRALHVLIIKPGRYAKPSKRLGKNLMRAVRQYLETGLEQSHAM